MKNLLPLLAIYVLSLSLWSCSGTDDTDTKEPSKFGRIEGQIKDMETGEGIPDAELVLTNDTPYTPEMRGKTDSSGSYKFENLDRGNYKLYITKKDYQPDSLLNIQVVINQTANGDKKLKPEIISIEGIVTANTNPLQDAYVYLIPVRNSSAQVEVNTGTDKDGKFSFANLPKGEKYKLFVFKDGFRSITDREITVPDKNANVQMTTRTAGTISFDKAFIDMGESSSMAVLGINTGVNQNLSWNLTSEASWITLDTATGNGNTPVIITIDRNYLSGKNNERSARIIVTSSDGKHDELWVIVSEAGSGVNIGDIIVLPARDITSNSASISCVFLDENLRANAKQIGVCYSLTNKTPVFETDDSQSVDLNSVNEEGTYTVPLQNLLPGKTYYARAYVINKITNKFHYSPNIRQFTTTSSNPAVSILPVSKITETTALFQAEIAEPGEPVYTERGFVYSTTQDPTIANTIKKLIVTKTGELIYNYDAQSLNPYQKYHVRAYLTNENDTYYSGDIDFTTAKVEAQVVTSGATGVGASTATFNAMVTKEGSPGYTQRGFCYNTSGNPTIEDQKIIVSGVGIKGNYNKSMTGLDEGVTYFVRAYVLQDKEAIYGATVDFTTGKMPVVRTDDVTELTPNYIDLGSGVIIDWSSRFNGAIESAGDPEYTQRGFVYDTSDNPVLSTGTTILVSGNGTGIFSVSVSSLSNYKTYYVRAYIRTPSGKVVYGASVSFHTYDF